MATIMALQAKDSIILQHKAKTAQNHPIQIVDRSKEVDTLFEFVFLWQNNRLNECLKKGL